VICPNCGASNSTRATFCRRCHQRLPVAGLAAGVTYPRRRTVASGGNRLPILAALFLALAGLVVGAMLVGLAGARPGPTLIAGASGTPVSSLPAYVQETPTPGPPTPTPFSSFPSLPTPPPSVLATATPFVTPPPSTPTPTPTPSKTPKPTPSPTPTPTPTPTPAPLTCANATGTPTDNLTVGYGNKPSKTSKGWCLDYVIFHVVTTVPPGSTFGESRLQLNGKTIATFDCSPPAPCQNDVQVQLNMKLAKDGASVAYDSTCTGDPSTPDDECTTVGYNATATFYYELATPATP